MSDGGVNVHAIAKLAYRIAEHQGAQSPIVRLLKEAAETGDPDIAAEAYDALYSLPLDHRRALASWLSELMQPVPLHPNAPASAG